MESSSLTYHEASQGLLLAYSEGKSTCGDAHLEGPQCQLEGQADAQASIVGQEVKDDVVNSKQWDEEECGLGETPAGQTHPGFPRLGSETPAWALPTRTATASPGAPATWNTPSSRTHAGLPYFGALDPAVPSAKVSCPILFQSPCIFQSLVQSPLPPGSLP